MPNYTIVTMNDSDRGPEPLLREPVTIKDKNQLVTYRASQEDTQRVIRFTLASLALKFFGDEDLDWIIRDANPSILDDKDLKIGDVILIPKNWAEILSSSKSQGTTQRKRVSRIVR